MAAWRRNFAGASYKFLPTDHRRLTTDSAISELDESEIWNSAARSQSPEFRKQSFKKNPSPATADARRGSNAPASTPVNVPDWSKILKHEYRENRRKECDDDVYSDGNGNRTPPHEFLARTRIASLSVHEGIGRTLKGRDLSTKEIKGGGWDMERSEIEEKLLASTLENGGEDGEETTSLASKVWSESKKMWIVAGPAIFTRFSTFGINVISQAFVGHVGATELAAYSLVATLLTRFANGLTLGVASGFETLCGQAYGAKQYHMLGIYLQRSWIVLTITATLIVPIYVFSTPILKSLGQDEIISEVAGKIALWFIPVVYSFMVSYSCQMFLQAQSKNRIISYLAAASLTIHMILSWLLTFKLGYGLTGALISTILAYWIPNLGQLLFVISGGCRKTWKGFSTLAFEDLFPAIKLSLSSGAMLCLELWYNAILILLTGNLKNAEVEIDALSICLNINGWEMMISLGFLSAASVRVANELGMGDSKAAKFSVVNIVLTSFAIGFVLFVIFLFLRERVAYIFTEDKAVAAEVARLSPLLAFSILLNSVQPVLSGVAIGAGWQSTVVYVNLASYYLLGIPLGFVLGYTIGLQVEGVWIGMLVGTLVQTIALLIITRRTDWDKQAAIAKIRVNKWFVEDESAEIAENTIM
ncbi:protein DETOXIFICATION 21-like [Andrographis paniculata]|uniref:protein DETOXIFICATION 21-like n=1 Tax=Andrographis paniculata TaxID=175694 RepID=UPI0021E89614|nr:protein DETOXIFICATION 21-like [Andrographis paniculata]XP_051120986.1 protein DETOXIFICATION 21-like [Andrographis paniculata]